MYSAFLLIFLVAGAAGQCVDQNTNCPNWAKNGFCTNSFYASMVSQCAKSCNRCSTANNQCGVGVTTTGPCVNRTCTVGYTCNLATSYCCPTTAGKK